MIPKDRRIAVVSGVLALVLLIAGAGVYLVVQSREKPAHEFTSGSYPVPNPATDLALTDQNGQPFTLADHRGKVILLYFGYTYCPDYCPTTLADFQQVRANLGEQASEVEVVFVSVDPARDTPARMKEYLAFFDPTFIGVTGTQEELKPIERDYFVQVSMDPATPGSSSYLVSHSTSLYAIDQEGNLRLTWPYGTSTDDLTTDVRYLLNHPDSAKS